MHNYSVQSKAVIVADDILWSKHPTMNPCYVNSSIYLRNSALYYILLSHDDITYHIDQQVSKTFTIYNAYVANGYCDNYKNVLN